MFGVDFCGANAITKVKRSEFNMGKNVPAVGDDVTIKIAIEAKKALKSATKIYPFNGKQQKAAD